jgi:hypothetical protein
MQKKKMQNKTSGKISAIRGEGAQHTHQTERKIRIFSDPPPKIFVLSPFFGFGAHKHYIIRRCKKPSPSQKIFVVKRRKQGETNVCSPTEDFHAVDV